MVKNCSIVWRVSSSKISVVAIVVAVGALTDPVSTTVIGVLSGAEGGTLVSLGVSWVRVDSSSRSPKELQDLKL